MAKRQLNSLTIQEYSHLFRLCRGLYDDAILPVVKQWSSSSIYVKAGYGQFIFGYINSFNNDVRLPDGISFFLHTYLIEDNLEVDEMGIRVSQSGFNSEKTETVENQSLIFKWLIENNFDF